MQILHPTSYSCIFTPQTNKRFDNSDKIYNNGKLQAKMAIHSYTQTIIHKMTDSPPLKERLQN